MIIQRLFCFPHLRNVRQWRQRNKEQTDKVEIETSLKELTDDKKKKSEEPSAETTAGSETEKKESGETVDKLKADEEKNEEDKMDTESSENSGGDNGKDSSVKEVGDVKQPEDMDIIDNTECKFNVNSFKLVYVVNSESYLYKRMALKRAREVNVYTNTYLLIFQLSITIGKSLKAIYLMT